MELLFSALDRPVQYVCEMTGAEVTGTRLFVSLLYVYPLTLLQDVLFRGSASYIHHLYHTSVTFFLLYFNFNVACFHFFANTLAAFLLIALLPPGKWLVILSFLFNMAYLFVAYLAEDVRHISFTTPHCVLTLKLIGLTWDIYDNSSIKKDSASKSQEVNKPSLLEVFGFVSFPAAMMTGPQFSFSKYRKLTNGHLNEYMDSRLPYCALRLFLGLAIILAFPFLNQLVPMEYMATDNFLNTSLWYKMCYVTAWGQVCLSKFLGVWLIAEGSCILSGMAYNGNDEKLNPRWDGSANIVLIRFFTATKLQHYIESWNINTNSWVLNYVFKKMRFMNNRYISQFAALFFLAVWHGYHSGYFMCFFLEFLMMFSEKQMEQWNVFGSWLDVLPVKLVFLLISKLVCAFQLSYALLSFISLDYRQYMQIYSSMYYFLHILHLAIFCTSLLFSGKSKKPLEKKH